VKCRTNFSLKIYNISTYYKLKLELHDQADIIHNYSYHRLNESVWSIILKFIVDRKEHNDVRYISKQKKQYESEKNKRE